MTTFKEKETAGLPGLLMFLVLLLVSAIAAYGIYAAVAARLAGEPMALRLLFWTFVLALDLVGFAGIFTVQPTTGMVLQLFGRYVGTVKQPGLLWVNPFYSKRAVSLRIRNFETNRLKVNDHDGNPIEIASVVVWKVVDSAEATFQVENYENYVHVQSEAALRNLATAYPYDAHLEGQMSLRGTTGEVAAHLKREIQERLAVAGVDVVEARISHLAYAPEIAAAMLQRQQASAIIAARQKIVEGAVGMVEMALDMLSHKNVVQLDEERKAAMVSNLLVVLCGERNTQPVVNAGTIYH
jgi:regulator of protease activity HflC (stomatin/prohibitin superfamily)